uniref:Uncharacterized protein n=1 Tax=viral metagenome TaxID=1070528 RepID=A0A6C0ANW1_9ZZZZ
MNVIKAPPTSARLGNKFFMNMAISFLSAKYKQRAEYAMESELNKLGIDFHREQKPQSVHEHLIKIDDNNFMKYIQGPDTALAIEFQKDTYCQKSDFCQMLKSHFADEALRTKIRNANPWTNRIGNNHDVFIHVRIGDVQHLTPSLSYYEKALSSITYEKGYISSDSPNHPMINTLCQKYGLIKISDDQIRTIQFGSTCDKLILSHGTYSWLIGFLNFDSTSVQYPKIKHIWHGDIFVFPEWTEVDW